MHHKDESKKNKDPSRFRCSEKIIFLVILSIFLFLGTWGILESISLFIRLIMNVGSSSLRNFDLGLDIFGMGVFMFWTIVLARWFADFIADWMFHQI